MFIALLCEREKQLAMDDLGYDVSIFTDAAKDGFTQWCQSFCLQWRVIKGEEERYIRWAYAFRKPEGGEIRVAWQAIIKCIDEPLRPKVTTFDSPEEFEQWVAENFLELERWRPLEGIPLEAVIAV